MSTLLSKLVKQSRASAVDPVQLGMLSLLAGQLGGVATTEGLRYLLAREGKGMGHTSPQRIKQLFDRVKAERGLDIGYMHAPDVVGSNAGYTTSKGLKESVKSIRDMLKELPEDDTSVLSNSERRKVTEAINNMTANNRKHGLVLTGTHFKKPGTVEHELGHAIAAHQGNPVEKAIIQKNIPDWSPLYHSVPSHAAAFLAGKHGPLKGALAGALAGLVTNAPTLYSEYSANKYGDELIDKSKPIQGKYKAYGTYLAGSALPAALTGAVYGLGRKYLG